MFLDVKMKVIQNPTTKPNFNSGVSELIVFRLTGWIIEISWSSRYDRRFPNCSHQGSHTLGILTKPEHANKLLQSHTHFITPVARFLSTIFFIVSSTIFGS